MLEYSEVKEAVAKGYIQGDRVHVVRKNGKLFDYVLPGEPVKPEEVVTVELVSDLLRELKGFEGAWGSCR